MRKASPLLLCIVMLFTLLPDGALLRASHRKVLFNKDWKFHLGPVSDAEQPRYDDTRWRILHLPHDWSVEPLPRQKPGITQGPFSRMSPGDIDTGQTVGGEGWYRKTFTLADADAGRIITLYFEGVYNQSELWINGRKAHFNPYGYTSYKVDITPYLNAPGTPNLIALKVVNAGRNSRWYAGSGIFRHVWLMKTDKLHLEEWDTYVDASRLQKKEALLKLSTIVHHEGLKKSASGRIDIKIYSPAGTLVCSTTRQVQLSAGSRQSPVDVAVAIRKPQLWSVDSPVLYTAVLSLSADGRLRDEIRIPFGIRTLSFSADKGFLLNGKPLKLKGGCIHHDNGLLGAAAIPRAEERKVELMKANGYNAVRCAHNQVSEHFLHACDRLGLLVIHETFDQWQAAKREDDYHQYFDEWSDRDLAASVRRDRNHPSIIMWSIGNEVAQRADVPEGDLISRRLVETIRRYDPSRFTTIGSNDFWDRPRFSWDNDSHRIFQNLDVAGYNYIWQKYESDHAAYPSRVIYGSESYPKEAARNWNLVEKHPYVIGDFVWTAIDYLGEAGLAHTQYLSEGERDPQFMGWPWYNGWCGDIDLCGDKKPQSYYRDVLWRQRPIALAVHAPIPAGKREVVNAWGWPDELQSWNWPGLEGQTLTVNVYSRAPRVKLYLNDRLIGERETDKENYTATFEVPYEPGVLKAVTSKGKEAFELKTAGPPASIRLTADRARIKADRNDLSFVKIELVDKDGNVVPDAALPVKITCTGQGNVIAGGNAAYDDMKSFRSLTPNTFRGRAIAIVQPTEEAGEIKVTVSAEGLAEAEMVIKTVTE